MSKATSLNNIDNMDPNVSHEIDNVLAEIETSKHNKAPQQLPQQISQPQQYSMPQMPPMKGQQLPPQQPQQYIQNPNPNYAMPNFYHNQPQRSGIMEFLSSFMIVDNELKWMGIIVGLFLLLNMTQTINLLGKYLPFTMTFTEMGNKSSILGMIARGLIFGLLFVLINKFM